MDDKLIQKFTVAFQAKGQLKKKPYLTKFQTFVEGMEEVTKEITQDVIKITNIEIQVRDFFLDEPNDQTLIKMSVVVDFEGPIKQLESTDGEYLDNICEFIQGWLDNFKETAKKSKTKKPTSSRQHRLPKE